MKDEKKGGGEGVEWDRPGQAWLVFGTAAQ
jgi:hypothetical protein